MKYNLFVKSYLPTFTTVLVISALFYLLFRIMQPFLYIFVGAGVLSILLSPLSDLLSNKFNLSKSVSSLFVILFSVVLILIPAFILLTLLASEVSDLLHYIQLNYGESKGWLLPVYNLLQNYGISTASLQLEVSKYSANFLKYLSSNLTGIFSRTLGFIIDFILTFIVAFNFLAKREEIIKFFIEINPLNKEDATMLTNRASEVITATIRGYLGIMLIQAVAGIIGFSLFSIPSPVLFGMVYGIASIVPMVGISLVWIPAVIYLLITGQIVIAFSLAAWCILSNFVVDNFVGPKIVADNTKLHPLAVLFGVLGGIEIFGIYGIIMGPTVVALAFSSVEIFKKVLKN